MRKILTILFCLLLTISSSFLTKVKAEGTTVYVDPTGETAGAYATLEEVANANALPNGGTIVIKSDANTASASTTITLTATGKITIVGETSSVKLTQKRALIANCELEIDNLVYVNGATNGFDNILCQGNNVTIGSGVTTLPNGSRYINIYAGKTTGPLSGVNSTINIHGGHWSTVWCGNNSKAFHGTVNYDFANTTIETFALSGHAGASDATINATIHNGTNITSIQKTENTGTYTGTATVTLEGGTIGGITDVVPDIDFTDGGTLTINSSATVGDIVGGGTLNLGNGVTLTADDLAGTTNLSITNPVSNTTYLTVNNTAATGSINYIPQSTEVLNRTVDTAIEYTIGEAPAPVVVDTVYLDPAGTSSHTEHVYTSMGDAIDALPVEGGTVIVCSEADFNSSTASTNGYVVPSKSLRITGESQNVVLNITKSVLFSEDATIDNITLNNNASDYYSHIYAQGYDLTIGENVTCIKTGTKKWICLLTGSRSLFTGAVGAITNGNGSITVKSGTFREIFAGGMGQSSTYSGTATINIEGGTFNTDNSATVAVSYAGSSSTVNGTVNVNVSGGSIATTISSNNANFTGTANLNLSGGTISAIDGPTTSIDLTNGGTLTLNNSLTVDSITGGGNLNLASGVALTADDLVGTTNLSIATPVSNTTYLTINNTSATGSINYVPQSTETLDRTVGANAIEYTIGEAPAPVVVDTVYLDPAGTSSHTEYVYSSIDDAVAALSSEGGTIIVSSDANINPTGSFYNFADKPLIIEGETDSVKLTLNYAVAFHNTLEINNISFVNGLGSTGCYIYMSGYNLTIGDNVTVTQYGSATYPYIFFGNNTSTVSANDQVITINSGHWGSLFTGGKKAYSGTATWNFNNCTVDKLLAVGSGSSGTNSADVEVNINNSTVTTIQNTNSNNVLPTGEFNINFIGGTVVVNAITGFTPNIDLSAGGNLTLNKTYAVDDFVGGGTLNLTSGVTLTANDLTGTTALNIANPVYDTTYLTINNTSATGSIDYIPKATETLERTIGVSAIEYTIVPTEVIDTVYVDPAGTSSHTEHVYSTVEAAINAITESSGTVYICSDVNFNPTSARYVMPSKELRIVGEDASVRLTQIQQVFLSAPLTIENLTWVNGASSTTAFVFTQGNDLTVGQNVTCRPNAGYYLCILAGSRKDSGWTDTVGNIVDGDSTITLQSGTFRRLFGAGMNSNGKYSGTLTINLEGANIGHNVYASGSGSGADFSGTYNLNVKDGSINSIKKNSDNGGATGTFNVALEAGDITEFADFTPNINLSQGGVLILNDSLTAGSIVGGGSLQLGANVTLTADSLTGTTDLYVDVAKNDFTYVTINDASTAGILNYASHGEGDSLEKVVGANDVQFVGKLITHDKTAQGILEPNGTVDLVFAATIDDSVDLSTAYIMINEEKTFLSDIADSNNRITIATPSVNPKQIADQFEICLYDGNDNPISSETNISVMDYVYMLINGASNDDEKDFYKSLLNYGAYAQTYFDYNLSTLANAGLSTAEKDVSAVSTSDVAPYVVNNEGSTEGISPYGQSLTLNNEVSYKVYFKLDGTHSISEYEFKDGETILTPHRYNDTYYYVRINNLAAPDLDTSHTISVKCNGVGSLNTTCSVLTYANIVLNDTNTSEKDLQLVDVVKALFLYNQKADAVLGG